MTAFLNKFRIPTLLGLSLLLLGIIAGVFLVIRQQNFYTKASPGFNPQNLTLTNTDDSSTAISWQTSSEAPAFIIYGQNIEKESTPISFSEAQTALDDRDTTTPSPRTTHHITLKNLLPKTTYQYKITAGKYTSEILKFTTAPPASEQNGFSPIIGSVLNDNQVPDDAVAYLTISGAVTQSAVTKSGNFVIPISVLRKSDLSNTFPLEKGAITKITIISSLGESNAIFKLEPSSKPLPPLALGQNIDFTTEKLTDKNDLNGDGVVNAADHALQLKRE